MAVSVTGDCMKVVSAFGRGLVAEPAQYLQGDEDRQRTGQFADKVLDAVVNPLLAAAGAQFIPFDHIREHGIRQDVGGRDAQPGQEGHPQHQGDLSRAEP